MKSKIILSFLIGLFCLNACQDLNLNPLSEGSSENWYSNNEELEMSVSNLFATTYWDRYAPIDFFKYSDDFCRRTDLYEITNGTLSGQSSLVTSAWNNAYKCIASANELLSGIEKAKENITDEKYKLYMANAKFARAAQYSKLIFLFGDVPYYTKVLNIDEAFSLSRTSKNTILSSIYEDYDFAIENLPENYTSSEYQYATKGAALAMKARTALFMGDYSVAKNEAKACIDLGVYKLFSDFSTLFLSKTKNSIETIFAVPHSVELDVNYGTYYDIRDCVTRTAGGYCSESPSWDLFCSFLCTDGLPIDESPLFDSHKPFNNRDPRCKATIVEFGQQWLGYIYQPHPDTLTVKNYNTGLRVKNLDNRAVDTYASFNGLAWAKRIDNDWLDTETDNDNIIIRFADVLLIYAEAKIELNEIDQSVLDAINRVRARAYKVDYTAASSYPVVMTKDQVQLRRILRTERRMEFAGENNLRYNDIIRWKLAEKVLNKPRFGMLDVGALREKVVNKGLWFFPETPSIDDDGIPDFTSMYDKGLIRILAQRKFDATKQYLWPIPTDEIVINPNLTQNPGY